MTEAELRALYEDAKKIIRAGRAQRVWVFRNKPNQQAAKVGEMDELLQIVISLKDECKRHMEPEYEQPALLDVPRKAEYQ
jgi:hypothetical protein